MERIQDESQEFRQQVQRVYRYRTDYHQTRRRRNRKTYDRVFERQRNSTRSACKTKTLTMARPGSIRRLAAYSLLRVGKGLYGGTAAGNPGNVSRRIAGEEPARRVLLSGNAYPTNRSTGDIRRKMETSRYPAITYAGYQGSRRYYDSNGLLLELPETVGLMMAHL